MIGLIRALDLDQWASRITAPPEFPRLVRRLVHATGKKLQKVDFPADEAIRLAGYDGKVLAGEPSAFVPDGFSVWELGTEKGIKGKADDDYEKRTNDSLGVNKGEATFIFVTPRKWAGKTKWATSKNDENIWKKVIAYDAEDLTQWLESAPSVAAWLGPMVGAIPEDVRSLEDVCSDYRAETHPNLPLMGTTLGREEQKKRMLAMLAGPPASIEIIATTVSEGAAFVGSCIESTTEEESESMLARSVWVDSNRGLTKLASSDRSLIVLSADDLKGTTATHHRVVLRTTRGGSSSTIELGPQQITSLVDFLEKQGMERNDAYRRCREAGGVLERVRRSMLAVRAAPPDWASPPISVAVGVAALIGGWDERIEADKEMVAKIAGTGYEDLIRNLVPYQVGPEPLVSQVGTIWKVYSRTSAWRLLEQSWTPKQVQEFLDAAETVLLEPDPKFDLPPEERWLANVHGKVRQHSEAIREGLVNGLLWMAVQGNKNAACYSGRLPQDMVDGCCRRVFQHKGEAGFWRRLCGDLRTLAEASPGIFLASVESDVHSGTPQILDLFEEEGVHGGHRHTALIWALEILAWDRIHVGQSVRLLAALASIAKTRSNRPATSLYEILQPADPQGHLSSADRLALFKVIADKYPDVFWEIAKSAITNGQRSWSDIARPELRDGGREKRTPVLFADYWREVRQILQLMVALVGRDPIRWHDLLSSFHSCENTMVEEILDEFEKASSQATEEEKPAMQASLRRLLHHHNQFSEKEGVAWVYPRTILDRLETIYTSLSPANLVARHAWLFAPSARRPMNVSPNWQEEDKRLGEERAQAVEQLLEGGWHALWDVLSEFENTHLLGYFVGKSKSAAEMEAKIVEELSAATDPAKRSFLQGFSVARNEVDPVGFQKKWLSAERPDFVSPPVFASILCALPTTPQFWQLAADAGGEFHKEYWKAVSVFIHGKPNDALVAVVNLLSVGRARQAVNVLDGNVSGAWLAANDGIELVIQALDKCAEAPEDGERLDAYNVAELLKEIHASGKVDVSEMIRLEWKFFGALQYQAQHKLAIYESLLASPGLLVDLIAMMYLPEGTSKEDLPPVSEVQKIAADQAWRVLHDWAPYRGFSESQMPTAAELTAQVGAARALASERRHGRIVDGELGKALASCPSGADGIWPHESVRCVLEGFGDSEPFLDGFVHGKRSLRGVTSRRPGDGGEQERDLSKTYREWQVSLAVSHPITSRALGMIADIYLSDANREDGQARG